MSYIFGGDTGVTYEQLKNRRALVDGLRNDLSSQAPKNVGQGIHAIAKALVARGTDRMNTKAERKMQGQADAIMAGLFGGSGGASGYGAPANPPNPYDEVFPEGQTGPAPQPEGVEVGGQNYAFGQEVDPEWEKIKAGIFAGESGGDYDALFEFSQREGGAFEGVKPTQMTVGQIVQFTDPSGEYGQWVKGKVGRVATPVGAYQVVGTTLRDAIKAGVVSPNEQFTPDVQDRVGKWVLSTQGTGAWEGYKGPQDPSNVQVADNNGPTVQALMVAASNPIIMNDPGRRAVVTTLLQQALEPPETMTPYQRAQLDFQREKFEAEQSEPDLTAGQREYEMARQQGYEGTFIDYKRDLAEAQRAQTNVNVNTGAQPAPEPLGTKGQILVPDPSEPSGYRVEIAPNSELAMEQAQRAKVEENKESAQSTAADVVVNTAIRALGAARDRDVGGILGAAAALNPASNNAELYRQVSSLKSIASAEALNAMRRQSQTGGALGNVTEKELKLLSEQAGALDPMSPNFERDLRDYTQTMLRTIHGKEAGDAIFDAQLRGSFEPRREENEPSDFSGATMDDLLSVDPMTLDQAGLDAWERRMDELEAGR